MRKSNRRQEILQNAFRLLSERGYVETKMADIAEACGIAKATMYEYFSSKDELASAWCRDFLEEYKHKVEREVEVCGEPEERLKALIRLDLSYLDKFSGQLLIRTFGPKQTFDLKSGELVQVIMSIFSYHLELIISIVREGQQNGSMRAIDPEFAAMMILGTLVSFQRTREQNEADGTVMCPAGWTEKNWNEEMVIDYIFNGLGG